MTLKEEVDNPNNKCKFIILGNKDDDVYLKSILERISQNECTYIQTFIHPSKLAKINEFYLYFKQLGVKEIEKREKIKVQSTKDPKVFYDAILIKWEVIPRLMQYRESLEKEEY